MRHVVAVALLALAMAPAAARPCSEAEEYGAARVLDSLGSWTSVYTAYRQYGHCDDGYIAEGFSDKVIHLLATRWSTLPQLQLLVARDPAFQTFVVRHIDASADGAELDRVAALARQHCPRAAVRLCQHIAAAVAER